MAHETALSAPKAFPLPVAPLGCRLRIAALHGGAEFTRRLTELGLNVGCEITLQQREGGKFVVKRGETRFALGGGMAHKILVHESLVAERDAHAAA
jgi:ferrous iron transport protein A